MIPHATITAASMRASRAGRPFAASAVPLKALTGTSPDRPSELAAGTPFQGACWLGARYATLEDDPDVEPLPVLARSTAEGGAPALLLPLIRRRHSRLTMVEFADLGLTDYNAPLLGPAAPRDRTEAAALWRAVRAALPPADLALFTKMPASVGGRANPLAWLPGAAPSRLSGQLLEVGEDYRQWRRAVLDNRVRRELERAWRVFTRHEGAAFRRIRDSEAARYAYEDLAAMQRRRAREVGFAYQLDEPSCDRTYRRALETGLADGRVVLTVLAVGGETVAALYGLADGRSYVMLRIADAGGAWRVCTPGRLLMDRTMEHLHGEGYRRFDFALGEYAHKRRFKTVPVPLLDLAVPLSPRGLPRWGLHRAKAFVEARPHLERAARGLLAAVGMSPGAAGSENRPA
jgi:CelD/BcsL family acetyltransferase involved in cellulose biosynthesis